MDNLIFSLNATLPVFLIMMAGWAFRQCGVISESFASQMNRFVFKVALPVSLFTQLYDVDFAAVIARLCCRQKGDRAEFVQGAYRSSASLLGMAYIELIYGKATMGSLMMIGCVPLYNVAAVIILSQGQTTDSSLPSAGEESAVSPRQRLSASQIPAESPAWGKTLLGIVTNPIILGIVIGFVWSLTGLGLPKFLATSCDYIGRLASPMGLLSMGAALDFRKISGKIGPALVGTFLKLVGFAAIFIPLAVQLGFRQEKLVAALIMLASPSTVAGYIMAKNMGHEGTLSSSMVMISTLVSSLTLTFWLWLLRSRGLV